ncbi:uncharacterized protein PB18E9.04c-like [Ostrinia furnacalis]|uniref:uncharacterized protein PB18E9.04c-like n=1 Tax=Ostrinia furnacalis TaxID=93504 RepID=UPI00103F2D3C|nr:uncharacterized protein PB18E9.04c-like [Ostrinia furnacalis]XP_028177320.1 uncharacterized protein PB18E9.04c-like [Ostrinia furnacalis]
MLLNKDFAAGEYKTPQGAAQIERQWEDLKAALDELGPSRSVEQWKTCWRDQKRKARAEGGALNKAANTTGNSVPIPELSENSSLILQTIGKEMAMGVGLPESPIGFHRLQIVGTAAQISSLPIPSPPSTSTSSFVPTPSTSTSSSIPTPSTSAPLSVPVLPCSSTSSAPIPPPPSSTGPKPKNKRRVRTSHPPDRFLAAQLELNSLIKSLNQELRQSNILKAEQNRLLMKISRRRQL